MEPTEADLIAAVLRGNAASFEPLVQRYSPRVFATARRMRAAKAKSKTSRRKSGSRRLKNSKVSAGKLRLNTGSCG
jgi:hypothetical protein